MSDDPRMRRLKGLRPLVGETPLVSVRLRYRGRECRVHAKAEYLNLTGSIKDRMAYHICRTAIEQGVLGPGDTIVEATSGNTGIAFSALGAALGHPVVIFMPDWMSEERKAVIRSFGADIRLVSREAGGFLGSIESAETLARDLGRVFLPRQFDNQANVQAHATTTGPELVAQLASLGLVPDAFVAGVGTGGTVMGVAEAFTRRGIDARVHPLEPAESPTLSTGHKVGRHRIQGVSDEFIPSILRLDRLAPVIQVSDGDAILMAQKLARELGLGVGISSGANLLGALQVLEREGPAATVATIFCDDTKKYLSTDLAKTEPVRDGFMSPEVELLDFETTLAATPADHGPAMRPR
ncbi:MAG: PLP-dependent cysteine synthase family protein [Planctomycetaceae bacterium]